MKAVWTCGVGEADGSWMFASHFDCQERTKSDTATSHRTMKKWQEGASALLFHDTISLLSRPPNILINDFDGFFKLPQTHISLYLLLSASSVPTMPSNSQVATQSWLPGAGEGCHLVLMNATPYAWKRKDTGSYQLTAWRFPKDIKPGERHSRRRHCRNLTVC